MSGNNVIPKSKQLALETAVFVCGAVVMIYEIVGSRVVAPFIGTSTYVWTSLIGVILAALSIGYWYGGRLADRGASLKTLSAVIFGAGGAVALTVLLKDLVLSLIASTKLGLELEAVIAATVLFAPASVLLGFVTPLAVKIRMSSLDETGRTIGRLYALSTVGSIAGTFLAGFFLIPFVGSTRTLYLLVAALCGVALLLAPFAISRLNIGIILLFFGGIATNEALGLYLLKVADLHDFDTEYNRVRIFTTKNDAGRNVRVLAIDPKVVQSSMYLDSDEMASEYSRFYHLVAQFRPDFSETLLIGGAGYSWPKEYLRSYPGRKIDVVEIDPGMTQLARDYFRMKDDPSMKIYHEDGRTFLNSAPASKYDAVFVDAFNSLFTIPFHLTTVEAVTEIRRTLKPDGVAIVNIGGAIKGPRSDFMHAEVEVYRHVFRNVEVYKVRPERGADESQNLIIVASDGELDVAPRNETMARLLASKTEVVTLTPAELTDDRAPVEYLNRQR